MRLAFALLAWCVAAAAQEEAKPNREQQPKPKEIADEATYDLWGVYLQDEFSIGALDVTQGIRFSRAEVEADEVDPNPTDLVVFNPLQDDYTPRGHNLSFSEEAAITAASHFSIWKGLFVMGLDVRF